MSLSTLMDSWPRLCIWSLSPWSQLITVTIIILAVVIIIAVVVIIIKIITPPWFQREFLPFALTLSTWFLNHAIITAVDLAWPLPSLILKGRHLLSCRASACSAEMCQHWRWKDLRSWPWCPYWLRYHEHRLLCPHAEELQGTEQLSCSLLSAVNRGLQTCSFPAWDLRVVTQQHALLAY